MVLNYHMGALGQVGFFCLIVFCVFVCVLNVLTPKRICLAGFFVFQSLGRLSSLFLLNALKLFYIYSLSPGRRRRSSESPGRGGHGQGACHGCLATDQVQLQYQTQLQFCHRQGNNVVEVFTFPMKLLMFSQNSFQRVLGPDGEALVFH